LSSPLSACASTAADGLAALRLGRLRDLIIVLTDLGLLRCASAGCGT
jgi:hypothetical protein